MTQSLDDIAKHTDGLTYLNAIKVSLTQIRDEFTTQEELRSYHNQSMDRVKRLLKKVDAQYRLFARVVTKESPYATNITVDDTIPADFNELKELMENG